MRIKTFGVVAAAAILGLTATMLTTSSAQEGAQPVTLKMRFSEASFQMVDEPPRMTKERPSESPGDSVVSRGWLRDSSGERVGRLHSIFTVTGGKTPRTTELVTATFKLGSSQIVVQGVTGQKSVDVLSVVGGTGEFEGARGSVESTDGRRAVTFVFNLTA